MQPADRYRGALLGLATGDALGTTLEFRAPGSFNKIDDMAGGGPFDLAPGEWTDDTSMALCLAESLIETGRFDPIDQLERYIRWADHAHLSSNGTVFDIGNTVRKALANFRTSRSPHSGPSDEYSAGNGSLMRLAAIPLFFSNCRKPQSKSLARALAQLMELHPQSTRAGIWALSWLGR
jgi:ADP-ribosyl-[dinitrogen reductase] hydrolase